MFVLLIFFQIATEGREGFKSIHQFQYEQHAESLKPSPRDTAESSTLEEGPKVINRFKLTFGSVLVVLILVVMVLVLVWLRRWFYSSY